MRDAELDETVANSDVDDCPFPGVDQRVACLVVDEPCTSGFLLALPSVAADVVLANVSMDFDELVPRLLGSVFDDKFSFVSLVVGVTVLDVDFDASDLIVDVEPSAGTLDVVEVTTAPSVFVVESAFCSVWADILFVTLDDGDTLPGGVDDPDDKVVFVSSDVAAVLNSFSVVATVSFVFVWVAGDSFVSDVWASVVDADPSFLVVIPTISSVGVLVSAVVVLVLAWDDCALSDLIVVVLVDFPLSTDVDVNVVGP